MEWKRKHLLGVQELSRQEIELILETAASFKEVSTRDIKKVPALRGKTVLLFFWADWCGDCKAQVPTIAQLQSQFATSGLVVLAPTQIYGVELGKNDAPPADDVQRVQAVWHGAYAPLAGTPVPLSAGTFRRYGASTVPTLVLISPKGEVVMYHPGRMSYDQLATRVTATLRTPPAKK